MGDIWTRSLKTVTFRYSICATAHVFWSEDSSGLVVDFLLDCNSPLHPDTALATFSTKKTLVMEITGARPVPDLIEQQPPSSVKGLQEIGREVSPNSTDDEYPLPTADESETLRRVAASLPLVSFSLCLVEFAERASYYGAKTVFSNFIEFALPKGTSHIASVF